MTSRIRDAIAEFDSVCRRRENPSDSLKRIVSDFCRKQYIFDMVHVFRNLQGLHVSTVKIIAGYFVEEKEPWGWLWLCSGSPCQYEDPMEWIPTPTDYKYLTVMINFLAKIDLRMNEIREISEYPLRLAVDKLLMSGAFHGCGADLIKEWATDDYYGKLLSEDNSKSKKEKTSLNCATVFIGLVAQLFEYLRLPRLSLHVGSALSYYGHDDKMSAAKDKLLGWLMAQRLYPLLLDLVLANFLIPSEGVLLPNTEKIQSFSGTTKPRHIGMFGVIDLASSVETLDHCILKQRAPKSAVMEYLLDAYINWHIRWGLADTFMGEIQRITGSHSRE